MKSASNEEKEWLLSKLKRWDCFVNQITKTKPMQITAPICVCDITQEIGKPRSRCRVPCAAKMQQIKEQEMRAKAKSKKQKP